ncbi:MAG TPA: DUF2508 family protein [Limnochordales bacterium]
MASAFAVPLPPHVPADLARLVERARADWLAARNAFEFATEPELVDSAIFALQAAERRYVYLLKLAARMAAEAAGAGQGDGGEGRLRQGRGQVNVGHHAGCGQPGGHQVPHPHAG